MAATILNQGVTAIRDAIATKVSHVGISTASDAFSASQTAIDPTAGTNLIKASIEANVDFQTVDCTMTVTGATEFTGLTIRTTAILSGSTRTDAMSRTVRSVGIGVLSGDVFTIGVRVKVTDQS